MKPLPFLCAWLISGFVALVPSTFGRGGFGGGGRGGGMGGGGFHGGGMPHGFSPSMSRTTPSFNRPTPNFSRPTPNISRPSSSIGRSGFDRPAGNAPRPNLSGSSGDRMGEGRINPGGLNRNFAEGAHSFERPNRGELNDFLGMPHDTASRSNLGGTHSWTTDSGATITAGGRGGSRTTEGGATIGGGAAGIKVEGAGGNTYVKGKAGIGVSDGDRAAVAGGSIAGIKGAEGDAAVRARGGYADTSGYRQGGSVTATRGREGYTAVHARGGYGYGDGTGRIGSATAVRGPNGNAIATGRGGAFVNGQFVGGRHWEAVNGNFRHWNWYSPAWFDRYPGAWWPGRWATAATVWTAASWATAGAYCGCDSAPIYYDYGDTVYYDSGNVYSGDEQIGTSQEYYDSAAQIASSGAETTDEQWLPLGVFAVTKEGETSSDKTLQLAVNKQGAIRGNYHDELTDKVVPVTGAVDKETQRVALHIGDNERAIVETGLYNLTNDEVPILVHLGPDRQENRVLVRLSPPADQ